MFDQISELYSSIDWTKLQNKEGDPAWYWTLVFGTALGFLTNMILPELFLRVKNLLSSRKNKNALIGHWHIYNLSFRQGRLFVAESTAEISRGLRNRYQIKLNQKTPSDINYEGHGDLERGQIIFRLKAREHQETLLIRFKEPLGGSTVEILSIWLGYDHETEVATGGQLFSKEQIDIESAKNKILKGITTKTSAPFFKITNEDKENEK